MNDEFVCYSVRLANYLIKKGHEYLRTEINVKYPGLYVYIFTRTPELLEDFDVWQSLPNQFKNI